MNLARVLTDASAEHSGRPALLHDGRAIGYEELERRAGVVAALLRARGVEPGDRVAIRLPNGPEFVAAWFGVLRAGAIAVPLNLLLAPPEVATRLDVSGCLPDDRRPDRARRRPRSAAGRLPAAVTTRP